MSATTSIPTTIEPAAAAFIAEHKLEQPVEEMLEHARQTIPGLRGFRIVYNPPYDTDSEGVTIEAVRDESQYQPRDPVHKTWVKWEITTFSPDVLRYLRLTMVYETNHGG